MPTLSEAKTLGGLGSVLMLLSFLPALGSVLAIVGAILVIIAIKYIADVTNDAAIFSNMLIAIILALAGVVVGALVVFASVLRFIGLGRIGGTTPGSIPPGDLLGLILGAIAGLALIWVLLLVSAVFVRKSYGAISQRLGVGMFGTAGLLYLVGAALTIVIVGFLLIFLALVLNIVAFFSIPDTLPGPAAPAASPPPQTA